MFLFNEGTVIPLLQIHWLIQNLNISFFKQHTKHTGHSRMGYVANLKAVIVV